MGVIVRCPFVIITQTASKDICVNLPMERKSCTTGEVSCRIVGDCVRTGTMLGLAYLCCMHIALASPVYHGS